MTSSVGCWERSEQNTLQCCVDRQVAPLCCQLISSQNQSDSSKVKSDDGIGPNAEWTNVIGPDALGASFGDITISSHFY